MDHEMNGSISNVRMLLLLGEKEIEFVAVL